MRNLGLLENSEWELWAQRAPFQDSLRDAANRIARHSQKRSEPYRSSHSPLRERVRHVQDLDRDAGLGLALDHGLGQAFENLRENAKLACWWLRHLRLHD